MSSPHRVLIIGGGFAGLNCARSLANDSRFKITLFDRENHHLFQPLLYQVATAALSAPDIARSLRAILTEAKNVSVLLDEITTIDPEKKEIRSAAASYPYDSLVIATGAKTSYFGNDHWAQHSIGLKSLKDARSIRHRVLHALEQAERSHDPLEQKRLMSVVIVGGGPTGVELAGAFSDLVRRALKADFRNIDPQNLRVCLIQSGDRVLKPFTPAHSEYTRQRLEALGVEVILGPRVDDVQDRRVHLNDDRWIEAETIIWAAGVQATSLTRDLDCPRDRGGRLEATPNLSLPGHPHIFAAGDLVKIIDHQGKEVPGLAPAALQMGQHIAKVLKEDLRLQKTRFADRYQDLRPAFTYRDKGIMAIIGKNAAVAEANRLNLRGFPAWLAWLFIHIAFLVGYRNKIAVLTSWAFTYLFDKPGARVFSITDHDS
ncbi:MAG: NAD(P)/FAD-dependent oxidoreductase [Verrucomicrobiaceae bacterium]